MLSVGSAIGFRRICGTCSRNRTASLANSDSALSGLTTESSRTTFDSGRALSSGDSFMPFDSLLFFGDAGNGDMFAFPIVVGPRVNGAFVWNDEDDSRTWVAPDLAKYLEWWADGRITT